MFRMGLAGVLAVVMAGLLACGNARASEEAQRWVAQGARLVDVRSVEEFAAGHIPGAVNIPVQNLDARWAELKPSDKPVVVYCRSGARSARAARLLKDKGFTRVLDLGAMDNWKATPPG